MLNIRREILITKKTDIRCFPFHITQTEHADEFLSDGTHTEENIVSISRADIHYSSLMKMFDTILPFATSYEKGIHILIKSNLWFFGLILEP